MSDSCIPMDCSPSGFSIDGIFPGKNTGVECQFHLQGIEFFTHGPTGGTLIMGKGLIQSSVFWADSEDGTNTEVNSGRGDLLKTPGTVWETQTSRRTERPEVSRRTRHKGKGALGPLRTRMRGGSFVWWSVFVSSLLGQLRLWVGTQRVQNSKN